MSNLNVGDRIWFAEERRPFTVRAVGESGRWVVCTKPFAARRTVLYTVLDLEEEMRGVDDRVFSIGYETDEDCRESLALFEQGISAHSRRHPPIPLNIVKVDPAKPEVTR